MAKVPEDPDDARMRDLEKLKASCRSPEPEAPEAALYIYKVSYWVGVSFTDLHIVAGAPEEAIIRAREEVREVDPEHLNTFNEKCFCCAEARALFANNILPTKQTDKPC